MTVLALKHYEDRIEIAADSGLFYGDSGMKENNVIKILHPQDDIHFAASGSLSELNLFELYSMTRKPEINTRHGILKYFGDFLKWKKDLTDKFDQENSYFFIFEETPYQICRVLDIQNIKVGEFKTLGFGMQEARCAMHLGRSPKEAVELCLELNCYTSGPIQCHTLFKDNYEGTKGFTPV